MTAKGIRLIILCLFFLTMVSGIISTPMLANNKESTNHGSSEMIIQQNQLEEKIQFHLLQDNTTTETTDETDETFSGLTPFIDEGLYYPLALLFSILGISSTIWLIFFVETSKERTIRDRIIGTTIRLIVMSICVGLAIHFWILFEPI
ncbi:MAG: hypothetical protein ACXACP_07505 [Candidatus Hodarchaeales archaeon]|jgi:hypothetical protein